MNELEWLSSHPKEAEKHSGKWVAITDRGIVASGDSVSEVRLALKGKEAMIMKMPRKDEEMSISITQ